MKVAAAPFLFVLFIALAVGPLIGGVTAVAARSSSTGSTAPLFAWVPAGGYPDRFPFGQCTWWAAYNYPVSWGGDARDWLGNARAGGRATSDEPSIGAIVVYRPGGSYSPLGHVAIVVAVGPTAYTVSEMNAPAWGRISTRVIARPDTDVAGFIPRHGNDAP